MRNILVAIALAAAASTAAAPALAHNGENHAAAPQSAEGQGVIKAVNAKAGTVTIQHGPIAALKWPAMTMTFRVTTPAVLNGVTVGKKVHFVLVNEHGKPAVSAIHPL